MLDDEILKGAKAKGFMVAHLCAQATTESQRDVVSSSESSSSLRLGIRALRHNLVFFSFSFCIILT